MATMLRDKDGQHITARGPSEDMQDGILSYYLTQAALSDANVERRIAREPSDFRDLMRNPPKERK